MTLEWISFENDRRDQMVLALGSEFVYNELMPKQPVFPLHLDEPFHPLNPTNPHGIWQMNAHPVQPTTPITRGELSAALLVCGILAVALWTLVRKS